jgi:outer membrane biosynthesis protein TonB
MRVVLRELPKLKHAYNRKLRSNPGLQGKITVKFAIDEFGDVIFSEVMHDGTTVGDRELQNEFASIVKAWKFQRIPKPGDVTEVIYPFILSQ